MTQGDRSQLLMIKEAPFNAETPLAGLQDDLTPTNLHYVRSNFALPDHDGTLTVSGLVQHPLRLTVDDLQALGAERITVTMECAGNDRVGLMPLPTGEPWTGQAFGTATWTGVPLWKVLAQAGPLPETVEVSFTGADHGNYKGGPDIHFVRSLSLERAQDPTNQILIAWGMNDEPLTADHGAPLRLVVPGWYGMAAVKWLSSIECLPAPYKGQFQTSSYVFEWENRPWEPVTTIRPRAMITSLEANTTLAPGTMTVRGKAWSGTGAIEQLEFSVDGAGAWQPATLNAPASPNTWQDWWFDWTFSPQEKGRHVFRVRATDSSGATQPDRPEWNRLGYGNNAVQVLVIYVR